MRPALRRLIKPLLLVIFLSLLVWMVVKSGPAQLWATLCSMPGTIALCVLVWGVGYLLNAVAFRQVVLALLPSDASTARERVLTFWHMLRITVTGYAINYITPFGLLGGEPYRVLVLKSTMGGERATRSVVLYSTMHITSHIIFWCIAALVAAILFRGDSDASQSPLLAITFAGILGLFDWRHLPPAPRYKALFYEFLSRMVNVVEYELIMQALGFAEFGYVEAFLCVAFSSLFANVLFFSPMQLGTREGGILLALQYLCPELPAQELLAVSLSLSFATRIREIVWIAIGLLGFEHRKEN